MTLRFPLAKIGEDAEETPPAENQAECFICELCWDSEHDLDAFALLAKNSEGCAQVFDDGHVLSCHNAGPNRKLIRHDNGSFSTPCGAITHSGDARRGIEDEVDEVITIRCRQAPVGINEVLIFVAVHQGPADSQRTFKGIKKSQVKIRNEQGAELGSFRLSRFRTDNCVHVASIMLQPSGWWECVLVGEGFRGNLNSILARLSPSGPARIAAQHVLAIPAEHPQERSANGLVVASGISVTLDDLRRAHPSTTEAVLQQACGIIRSFDPDSTAAQTSCLTWGKEVQQAHGRIIRRWTAVNRSNALEEMRQCLAHLQKTLATIDLTPLQSSRGEGLWSRLTGSAESARLAVLRAIPKKKKEVDRIVQTVKGRKRALSEIRDRVEAIQQALQELAAECAAYLVAGVYLSEKMRQRSAGGEEMAELLERRCEGLTRTLGELTQSGGISQLSIQQTLEMINIAEHVVLISIPTWLTNFEALKTAWEQSQSLADADVAEVANNLANLSSSLQA